ncbi:MAG: hypothetical protein AAF919_11300 [Pseudomonadota bacterium]
MKTTKRTRLWLPAAIALAGLTSGQAIAQDGQSRSAAPEATALAVEDQVLVTVVFKHDQTMPIEDIVDQARANGFYDNFPPENAQVVSWTSAMGLGQVVALQIPAGSVRELNRAVVFGAWGAFSTDIYLTYDFEEIAQRLHKAAFVKQDNDQ